MTLSEFLLATISTTDYFWLGHKASFSGGWGLATLQDIAGHCRTCTDSTCSDLVHISSEFHTTSENVQVLAHILNLPELWWQEAFEFDWRFQEIWEILANTWTVLHCPFLQRHYLKTTFHSLVFEEEAQQNALARNEETGEKNHWICGIRTTTRVQQEAKLLKTYINKSFAIRVSCNILIHIIPVILGHIIVNEWRFQSHILLCTIWPKSVRIDQGVYVYDVGGMVLGKRHLKYNNIFTFCGRFYEE